MVDVQATLVEQPADAQAHPVRDVLSLVAELEPDLLVPLAQRVVVPRLLRAEVVRVRELERALDGDRVGTPVVREARGGEDEYSRRGGGQCGGAAEHPPSTSVSEGRLVYPSVRELRPSNGGSRRRA